MTEKSYEPAFKVGDRVVHVVRDERGTVTWCKTASAIVQYDHRDEETYEQHASALRLVGGES